MDVDSDEILNEKLLIDGVLEKYKSDGFIKAKVDIHKFGPSFFQQADEGKKGKKAIKNLPYYDFQVDDITNGTYSLKIDGVWRKDKSPDSGFSIRVLAILVNSFQKNVIEEEENDDEAFKELLKSKVVNDEE